MEGTEEKFPAQWALDLLEPTPLDRSNHIFKYYIVPLSTISFPFGVVLKNLIGKKPATASRLIKQITFNVINLVITIIHC